MNSHHSDKTITPSQKPIWQRIFSWIPRLILLGAVALLLLIQDPCGCGLANHYRLSTKDGLILVEMSSSPEAYINVEVLEYEIKQVIKTGQWSPEALIRFTFLPEYARGFNKEEIYSVGFDRKISDESLRLELEKALLEYRNLL